MTHSNTSISSQDQRRKFIKQAAYAAPIIMTMGAAPSFAMSGSSGSGGGGGGTNPDCPDQPAGEDCS